MKKTKEYIIHFIVFFIILFVETILISILTSSKTYATSTYSEKYFQNSNKNTSFATGYYFVEINGQTYQVPNIVSTNKYGTVEKKDNETEQIYSILPNLNIQKLNQTQNYNQVFDLKQYDTINEEYKKIFPKSEENLSKLFWILNNLCNTIDEDSKDDLLNLAEINTQIFKTYKINGRDVEQSEDDLIKVIQQALIWNICEGNLENIPIIYVSNREDGEKVNLNNAFKNYDNALEKLYTYFLNSAVNAVKNGYNYQNTENTPVDIDKTRAQISEENANYIIGPYKVTTNAGFDSFNVVITDGTNEISNAKLLKDDKKTEIIGNNVLEKIKSNLGNDFYISVPQNTSATKIRIELSTKFERKNLTYYSKSANEINNNISIIKVENQRTNYSKYDIKKISKPNFDLSLREFISAVNNKEPKEKRASNISQADLDKYVQGKSDIDNGTTIQKNYIKTPLSVNNGDIINIVIRVYNEGQIDGYANEITNYLQSGLDFIEDSEINKKYGWQKDSNNPNILKTSYLEDKKIGKFSSEKKNNVYVVNYEEIQLELKVTANVNTTDTIIKNITEISKSTSETGESDRDSVSNNLSTDQISNYSPGTSSAGKGYEDDDDFEVVNLVGRYFDLSLRFFVSQVISRNGDVVNYNREPKVDVSPLKNGEKDAIYRSSKSPVGIENADSIIYTIRVYNEGQIDGYADEVVTHLPEELEYVNDEFNANYGWIIDTTDETQRTLSTQYLSANRDEDNAILAFNEKDNKLNYKDVMLKLKLKPTATTKKEITTIAEIIKSSNKYGINDRDNKLNVSMPSDKDLQNYKGNSENKDELSDSSYYYKGQEDDDDFEKIVFEKFDLALRVFETGINGIAIKDRVPEVDSSQFGASTDSSIYTTCKYNHKKDVINVSENDKIEFTIRVYNEGTQNGYAKEIKNDIPDGLEFIPNDATNQKYIWKMYDSNNNETNDISQCAYVKTNYLSKENENGNATNLISSFDKGKMSSPNYKDVKIVLNIKLNNKLNRDISEKAQISDDSDEEGNSVLDIDSAPNEWNDSEDDQDEEKIHILKFDLSLKQEITQIITIEDGVQTTQNIKNNISNSQNISNNEQTTNTSNSINGSNSQASAINTTNENNSQANASDTINGSSSQAGSINNTNENNSQANTSNSINKSSSQDSASNTTNANNSQANASNTINGSSSQASALNTTNGNNSQASTMSKTNENNSQASATNTTNENKVRANANSLNFVINKNTNLNKVVKFKYVITIINEGEIAGTASEISDYIPSGFKFNQADNLSWRTKESKVVTNELREKMINPRESAKIELILTLDIDSNLNKTLSNVSEISNIKNASNSLDIDSTPNNNSENEDDYFKFDLNIQREEKSVKKLIPILIIIIIIIVVVSIFIIFKFLIK